MPKDKVEQKLKLVSYQNDNSQTSMNFDEEHWLEDDERWEQEKLTREYRNA